MWNSNFFRHIFQRVENLTPFCLKLRKKVMCDVQPRVGDIKLLRVRPTCTLSLLTLHCQTNVLAQIFSESEVENRLSIAHI